MPLRECPTSTMGSPGVGGPGTGTGVTVARALFRLLVSRAGPHTAGAVPQLATIDTVRVTR
jgi:hypothetical protein